ncbi:MAG: Endoribonuclease YbeY [Chlamydiia bacterium]|nr:Endoribonuclease YbeY [Chlamydiia bacterium]
MFVHFTNSEDRFEVSQKQIERVVTATLKFKGVTCDDTSIYFVTAEEISKLHKEYFNDPTPTDCITFPMDPADEETEQKILGEVFVCPEVAFAYSQENALDFNEELTLYIVHGLLHLLGFDDIEEEDRILMRKEEKECMDHLLSNRLILSPEIKKPYICELSE